MDNKPKGTPTVHIDETATVPLTYHEICMTRNSITVRRMIIGWAVSVVLVVTAFVVLWLQYDYVSTTEYTGVYNLTDSEGNIISSDLSPEDVIRIMEELNNGDSNQD